MTPLEFASLDPEGFINLFGTRRISPSEVLDIIEKNVERVIRVEYNGKITKVSKGLKVSIVNPFENFNIILCTYLNTAIDIYIYKKEITIHKTNLVITNYKVDNTMRLLKGTRIFKLELKGGKAIVSTEKVDVLGK